MLEAYQPPPLDRSGSSIRDRSHGWTKAAWLTAHEHITEWEAGSRGRPSTTQAVDAVAGVLRGDYEIEDTYSGKRLIKTRVVDVGDPEGPRAFRETGSLFDGSGARAQIRVLSARSPTDMCD